MGRTFISILALLCVAPFAPTFLANAQQHAPALPAMSAARASVVAPVRTMAIPSAPVPGTASVHPGGSAPVASVHPVVHPAASAHPAPPRSASHAVLSRPPANSHTVYSTPGFVNAPFANDDLGVPGLGFDYVHYAAVHPNAGHHRFNTGFGVPFLGGEIYMPYPVVVETVATAEQAAPSSVSEAQEPVTETAETGTAISPAPGFSGYTAPKQVPEYVFVRRDGTLFFAVAYSFNGNNLRFITQDGLPKSVVLSSLDLSATRQFNDERGVSLGLPY